MTVNGIHLTTSIVHKWCHSVDLTFHSSFYHSLSQSLLVSFLVIVPPFLKPVLEHLSPPMMSFSHLSHVCWVVFFSPCVSDTEGLLSSQDLS